MIRFHQIVAVVLDMKLVKVAQVQNLKIAPSAALAFITQVQKLYPLLCLLTNRIAATSHMKDRCFLRALIIRVRYVIHFAISLFVQRRVVYIPTAQGSGGLLHHCGHPLCLLLSLASMWNRIMISYLSTAA